jgi:hypothetical protein
MSTPVRTISSTITNWSRREHSADHIVAPTMSRSLMGIFALFQGLRRCSNKVRQRAKFRCTRSCKYATASRVHSSSAARKAANTRAPGGPVCHAAATRARSDGSGRRRAAAALEADDNDTSAPASPVNDRTTTDVCRGQTTRCVVSPAWTR